MNAVRVPYILSQAMLLSLQPAASILDVGCGGGVLSEALVRRTTTTTTVMGVDLSGSQIAAAQAHAQRTLHPAQQERLEYRESSVEDLEPSLLFDVVCCLEVLEHIPEANRSAFLQAICQRVRPGGLLFVSTLNKTPKSFAAGIVGAEYVLRLLPVGTHTWEWFLSPADVERQLQPFGMQCIDVSGMVVHPSLSMLCGEFEWKLDPNDTDVNWIGCYRKEIGDDR